MNDIRLNRMKDIVVLDINPSENEKGKRIGGQEMSDIT